MYQYRFQNLARLPRPTNVYKSTISCCLKVAHWSWLVELSFSLAVKHSLEEHGEGPQGCFILEGTVGCDNST